MWVSEWMWSLFGEGQKATASSSLYAHIYRFGISSGGPRCYKCPHKYSEPKLWRHLKWSGIFERRTNQPNPTFALNRIMSAGLCERLVRGWVIVNIVLIWKPLHLWEVLNITTSARWNFEEYLFHVMETGSVNLKKGQNKHNENIIRVISMTHILYSLKMLHSVVALKSNVALLDMSDQVWHQCFHWNV